MDATTRHTHRQAKRQAAAWLAAEMLVCAFERGAANGGSIDWEDLELAYAQARQAFPRKTINAWRRRIHDEERR